MSPERDKKGKDDAFELAEIKMGIDGNGKDMFTSPGSETMACLT
jgi:hypothetical protein